MAASTDDGTAAGVVTGMDNLSADRNAELGVGTALPPNLSIKGTARDDSITGGPGNDHLEGKEGHDTLWGGGGNDTIAGNYGNDHLLGDEGNDFLRGGEGVDSLEGGPGDDTFYVNWYETGWLAEFINGGIGYDTMTVVSGNYNTTLDLSKATILGIERITLFDGGGVLLTSDQMAGINDFSGDNHPSDYITVLSSGLIDLRDKTFHGLDFQGSAGNDTILGFTGGGRIGGGYGDDSIIGSSANDRIVGGGGIDSLYGALGNDTFEYDNPWQVNGLAEEINGGKGMDTLRVRQHLSYDGPTEYSFTAALLDSVERVEFVDAANIELTPDQIKQIRIFRGTDGGLRLTTPGEINLQRDFSAPRFAPLHRFYGTDSDDWLTARTAGLDAIHGEGGNDVINGGAGNDSLYGEAGNDHIDGGAGDDLLDGGQGSDSLAGGMGDDTLIGGGGVDILSGGAGNDCFLFTGAVVNKGQVLTIAGGYGVDTLNISMNSDFSQTTLSSLEQIELTGYAQVTLTSQQIAGIKKFSDSKLTSGGIILNAAGTCDLRGKTLSAKLTISGSSGDDTMYGTNDHQTIMGRDGNDVIHGLGGNDTIYGGLGADTLLGGWGNDTFKYFSNSEIAGLAEAIDGGEGSDTICFGGYYTFVEEFSFAAATLISIERVQLLGSVIVELTPEQLNQIQTFLVGDRCGLRLTTPGEINLQRDFMDPKYAVLHQFYGTVKDDQIIARDKGGDAIHGDAGNDLLAGSLGHDSLYGDEGNDQILGGLGNDSLSGGTGNDQIEGGAGNDTLVGGLGGDVLAGGEGDDTLSYNAAADVSGVAETIDGGEGIDTLCISWDAGTPDFSQATITGIERVLISGGIILTASQIAAIETYDANNWGTNLFLADTGMVDFRGKTVHPWICINGSPGDDTIYGTRGDDKLAGGAGSDFLAGGLGNDTFSYAAPSKINGLGETIDGGEGLDSIVLTHGYSYDFTAATLSGIERVQLNCGEATITLTSAQLSQIQSFGQGVGLRSATSGKFNLLRDFTAAKYAAIHRFYGTDGDDQITARSAANDSIYGGGGNDLIVGQGAGDWLEGGVGRDRLSGGGGDDTLLGGVEADTLGGGQGNDTFRYTAPFEINGLAETIAGGAGVDTILLASGDAYYDFTAATLTGIERVVFTSYNRTIITLRLDQLKQIKTFQQSFWDCGGLGLPEPGACHLQRLFGKYANIHNFYGTAADDQITARAKGGDSIDGQGGNDRITGDSGQDTLRGGEGDDTVHGGDGNDYLTGGAGNDLMRGGTGDDVFLGGPGADTLQGGQDNDTFTYYFPEDFSSQTGVISGGEGVDTLSLNSDGCFNISLATITGVEQLRCGAWGTEVIMTTEQLAGITTILGNNIKITMSNSGTVDFRAKALSTPLAVNGSSGNDTIYTPSSSLSPYVYVYGKAGDDSLLSGAGGDFLDGGAGQDTVRGGVGNDLIRGGYDQDNLHGGADNDTFEYIDPLEINGMAEVIAGDNGVDTIRVGNGLFSFANATMTGIEAVEFGTDSTILELTPKQLAQIQTFKGCRGGLQVTTPGEINLQHNFADPKYAPIHRFYGTDSDDRMTARNNGQDAIFGAGGNDVIIGSAQDDTIHGGAGSDTLQGGLGNDTFAYFNPIDINNLTEVIAGGEGEDTIEVTGNWRDSTGPLYHNFRTGSINSIEQVAFVGDATIEMTAEQLGQIRTFIGIGGGLRVTTPGETDLQQEFGDQKYAVIHRFHGTASDDRITARSNGLDDIHGEGGNDLITGSAGDDTLNGGAGSDTLLGGAGSDLFAYDDPADINGLTEVIIGGEGVDTIEVTSRWWDNNGPSCYNFSAITLNGIEQIALRGATIELSTEQLGQILAFTGTDGGLRLSTPGEIDLQQEFGDQKYAVIRRFYGTASDDHMMARDAATDTIYGEGGNDRLDGKASNDFLVGGEGNDTLQGGTGHDRFVFDTCPDGTTNLDRISDFDVRDDMILLDSSVFAALPGFGFLPAANFQIGSGPRPDNALIIYNDTTGELSYDADGAGEGLPVPIAILGAGLDLTTANFLVFPA